MRIAPVTPADMDDWLALRSELWPTASPAEHQADAIAVLAGPGGAGVFLARDAAGAVTGFAEAALRRDYVNGCDGSPVGFLEGIYVRPPHRRKGIARALTEAVESWVRAQGCRELASDALLDNTASHAMHAALGFEETERVVYFRKPLA